MYLVTYILELLVTRTFIPFSYIIYLITCSYPFTSYLRESLFSYYTWTLYTLLL